MKKKYEKLLTIALTILILLFISHHKVQAQKKSQQASLPAILSLLLSSDCSDLTQIISMHYGIMRATPWQSGEETSDISFQVSVPAKTGDKEIILTDAGKLKSKLITYIGKDGGYRSNVVERINGNMVLLCYPLESDIDAGTNLFRFYAGESHLSKQGYYTLVDRSLEQMAFMSLNSGTHILLGDSWFDNPSFRDRLMIHLTNAVIIESGNPGNIVQQLIDRFDTDIIPHNPDFVWIMVGTNDLYRGTNNKYPDDPATFANNLKILESKIKKIGATAIIYDVMVGTDTSTYTWVTWNLHELSDRYSDTVHEYFKR